MSAMTRYEEWIERLACGEQRLYIVAEVANAHEGSLEMALRMVAEVTRTGADAIKFQCFTARELLVPQHPKYETFRNLEMPWKDWETLIRRASAEGLDVFCDLFGFESADRIMALEPTGFKIHLSDVPNTPLLRHIGACGRPVFLSTGGANWVEIADALDTLRTSGASSIVLINGIQRYPTKIEDSNLLRLKALVERFSVPVGYADHIDGSVPEALWLPYLAAAAGARLIEKHITLDRSAMGTDFYSSLNPDEFRIFVESARRVETALGKMDLALSDAEHAYRRDAMKSLVVNRAIKTGERISDNDVTYRRVDAETVPLPLSTVAGRTARHALKRDQQVRGSDLNTRIFASLACREQSVRLYAKPLQLVGDRPILKHLIDRLSQVERLDGVVLAVSEGDQNLAFAQLAKEWGLTHVTGDQRDVLGRHIRAAHSVSADVLLRVTTENPFVYQDNLDTLIEHHLATGADLTVCEPLPDGTYAEVINVPALERAHKFGEDRHRSELCTLFIFENPDSFKIERVQAPQKVARPDIRLTIDTPEDLIVARTVYAALEPKFGPMPPLTEIIKYLDTHPELRDLNASLSTTKLWR
jgi:N,N'-diacetyllegionaminate synthase